MILYLLAIGAAAAFAPRGGPPATKRELSIFLLDRGVTSYLARSADDFSSFGDFGREEDDDDGTGLAREFYQELEVRSQPPREYEYDPGDKSTQSKDKNKITSKESPFSRFFSSPTPRPATSAGLFTGSGTTVYSAGRSVRAEIEILETTLKNNDAREHQRREAEEWCRTVVLSCLIVLVVAYLVSEATGAGGTGLLPGQGAAASSHHVLSLAEGLSGLRVRVGAEDAFLGEEAAWLVRESSGLAAFVVDAVRSVEELVPS